MNGSLAGISICPCGAFTHPAVIFNPPGLSTLAYRVGDYTGFRHTLLQQALAGESELTQSVAGKLIQIWRPSGQGDLALQMMEWWAYLADVLTFYNERIANQAYLGTADLPESVNRLIQILGYRPRPGIGATAVLAALINVSKPFTLLQGFQVQSKPGPGKQPQIFELVQDTLIQPPGAVSAQPAHPNLPLLSIDSSGSSAFWLVGKVSSIKPNDKLLLLNNNWPTETALDYAWLTVSALKPQTDVAGNAVTEVTFAFIVNTIASGAQITDYQLLKSAQATHLWNFPTVNADVVFPSIFGGNGGVVLSSIVRQISVGDAVLFDVAGNSAATQVVTVAATAEQVWYANGDGSTAPPPTSPPVIPIPIPVTTLVFNQQLSGLSGPAQSFPGLIRYGWSTAGQLTAAPATPDPNQFVPAAGVAPLEMDAIPPALFPAISNPTVLIQDAAGNGAQATVAPETDPSSSITLSDVSVPAPGPGSVASPSLTFPFSLVFNLLSLSRGKTVANEILGSGNGALGGQDFTLKNSPVTYLQNPASLSGDNYSSTVRVLVNGVQWSEARSFYGQSANAQVFVTKEDEAGKTHIVFGDGVNGARLPSGTNNVVATYRYGSGADAPAADALTVVLQPQPGLKSVVNPIPAGGGADPDPPNKVRQLAPNSVLTFGRAVSLDDFAAIAASAPGVTKAKAAFAFDPLSQRPRVTVWVAGDASALSSAYNAIAAAADPNRLPSILTAAPLAMKLQLTLMLNPKYDQPTVVNAVQAALLDPDTGLFGANAVGIGQAYYDSQIFAACLAVPGVDAVHALSFNQSTRFVPWRIFFVPITHPLLAGCFDNQRHDPGNGNYFYVPNDAQHFQILPAVST